MSWYLTLFIVCALVVIIQSVFSFIEVDFDVDTDLELHGSDIFSFKGILHFLLGFTLGLNLFGTESAWAWGVSVAMGLLFIGILAYSYKFVMRKCVQELEYITEIKEQMGEIYYYNSDSCNGSVMVILEGRPVEIPFKGEVGAIYKAGDKIIVSGTRKLVTENLLTN